MVKLPKCSEETIRNRLIEAGLNASYPVCQGFVQASQTFVPESVGDEVINALLVFVSEHIQYVGRCVIVLACIDQ